MTVKRKIQIVLDLAMTVMLLVLMAYGLVGEAAHEWIGTAMFLLFILHHILNRQWYKNLVKSRYSAIRILGTVIDFLLLIIMIFQAVSGIMMAKHTFTFLSMDTGMSSARILHLMGAYWGFVLMSLHLGLHWNTILAVIRKSTHIKKSSVIRAVILRTGAVLLAMYGAYAFMERQLGSYMFLRNQFVFFDINESLIFFFIDFFAIMGFLVCIGYYVSIMLKKIPEHKLSTNERGMK